MKINKIIKTISLSTAGIFGIGTIIIPTMVLSSCSTADVYEITCDVVDVYVGYESSAPLSPKLTLNGTTITDKVTYQYTSSDETVATITDDGIIIGAKVGPVNITINAIINTDVVAVKSFDLTVIEPFITIDTGDVTEIQQNRDDIRTLDVKASVTPIGTASIKAALKDGGELPEAIQFNDKGAGTGTLTLAAGITITSVQTITITATCDGMAPSSVDIKINPANTEITITTEDDITTVTQSYQADVSLGITATVYPESITDPIEWSIKGISPEYKNIIAFVPNETDNNKATLTIKKGEEIKQDQIATITAICGELNSEIKITVNAFNNVEKLAYREVEGGYSVEAATGATISGDLTIPDTYEDLPIVTIQQNGFINQKQITSVIIPKTVKTISDYSFRDCSNLEKIILGSGVEIIGRSIFINCASLNHIDVTSNTSFSMVCGKDQYTGCLVKGTAIADDCSNIIVSIKDVILPDNVITIHQQGFAFSSSLTSIIIPNTVTSIGEAAFSGCDKLASVNIGSGLQSIEKSAFSRCPLTSIIISSDNQSFALATNVGDALIVVDKSGLLNSDCSNVISEMAFGNLTLPDTVISIGDNAFFECYGLTSITISDSVTSIGVSAFDYCRSLTSVTIPNSVTEIGDYAFDFCDGLTTITIPNSVKTIGDESFTYCNLITIEFGTGLISVGNYAFAWSEKSTEIITFNSLIPITLPNEEYTFFTDEQTKIYVPASAINAYKTAWPFYESIIFPIPTK